MALHDRFARIENYVLPRFFLVCLEKKKTQCLLSSGQRPSSSSKEQIFQFSHSSFCCGSNHRLPSFSFVLFYPFDVWPNFAKSVTRQTRTGLRQKPDVPVFNSCIHWARSIRYVLPFCPRMRKCIVRKLGNRSRVRNWHIVHSCFYVCHRRLFVAMSNSMALELPYEPEIQKLFRSLLTRLPANTHHGCDTLMRRVPSRCMSVTVCMLHSVSGCG